MTRDLTPTRTENKQRVSAGRFPTILFLKNYIAHERNCKETKLDYVGDLLPGGEKHLYHECVCSIGEGLAGGERRCGVSPGSLAGLVDLCFDVLDGGQLGDAGLWLLVGHLGGRGGEVLIAL